MQFFSINQKGKKHINIHKIVTNYYYISSRHACIKYTQLIFTRTSAVNAYTDRLLFTPVVHNSRITNATGWSGRADCHPGRSGGWTREEKMGRTVVGQSVATAVLDNAMVIIMIMIIEGHASLRHLGDVPTPRLCHTHITLYVVDFIRKNVK